MSDTLAVSRGTLNVDPKFNALLVEILRYLSGPDFAHALDRATEVFVDGLGACIFVDTATSANVLTMRRRQGVWPKRLRGQEKGREIVPRRKK